MLISYCGILAVSSDTQYFGIVPVFASFSAGHALIDPDLFAAELELSAAVETHVCLLTSVAEHVPLYF